MTKVDATVEFNIDPSFTGIMRGFANDESEGCVLTGTCAVRIHRPLKVRRLIVWFEGRIKVNLRGHSSIALSSTEMIEGRSLYYKSQQFISDDGQLQQLEPGTYEYPFSFELPATLPASFRGKYGAVRYRLQCTLFRPTFSSDIHASREVTLRRSLMGDHLTSATAADMTETVSGVNHSEQLHYSATATSMTYREGGLVRLNLNMDLGRPETQSVKSVTCALRETVRYRTTGERSLTYQACSKTDEVYPLGWSTFYPSQAPDYSAAAPHSYNAMFRLCPRVNADNETRLLDVKHSVVVNIMVEERRAVATAPQTPHEHHNDEDDDRKLSVQQIEHAFTTAAAATAAASPPSSSSSSRLTALSASQPTTPPVLSRSSSSSSITSIFSLRREHHGGGGGSKSNASSRRSSISGITPSSLHHREAKTHLTLCTLEIPVLVTSREHVWDGAMPSPPAYNTAEAPPSYFQTLEQLPAVPMYPAESSTSTAVQAAS
ncbi:hypothetical protein BDB00DRAFT_859581 [Zychaea mexicana]|uniref:uncharacterized protein n=1 Tax=Zychaea mexicana TaxID=64656 RepID=UPI0022FDD2AA|nr:uncharacterized protein BDB00DRAFT_859581 [Zychaea mexicana]KAI9477091.1 hypothetical protein BDB00DRAFT_859581 [Zychaea mexicana]